MSDSPKFTVVDRRKFRAEEENASEPVSSVSVASPPAPTVEESPNPPRLTLVEPVQREPEAVQQPEHVRAGVAVADLPEEEDVLDEAGPATTVEEASFQKEAYEKAAERLEDVVRAESGRTSFGKDRL